MNKEDILKCNSKTDVCKLMNIHPNGSGMKKVNKLLKEYDIPINVFKKDTIYKKNPKYCKECNNKIPYSKRINDFCSSSCSASFTNRGKRLSEEAKLKRSKKLLEYYKINKNNNFIKEKISKICSGCQKEFMVRKTKRELNRVYCSEKCFQTQNAKRLVNITEERIKNGTHKGWQSRNKLSYPEKFFIEVLKNNNLFKKCSVNYVISKRDLGLENHSNYFLDFFFEEKNIDLEIDGKQHEFRKEHDNKRDALLRKKE